MDEGAAHGSGGTEVEGAAGAMQLMGGLCGVGSVTEAAQSGVEMGQRGK